MPNPFALFLGLDIGTSGARALAIDAAGNVIAAAKAAMAGDLRDLAIWRKAADAALSGLLAQIDPARVAAISVDGTSGTMLAVDGAGRPLAPGLMYNDACEDKTILEAVSAHAPPDSAAHGASSALARALRLQALRPHRLLHQADWIAFLLSGRMITDPNNALKTGYDPAAARWPEWIAATGLDMALLPPALEPGAPVGEITKEAAARFGLPRSCVVAAGTTDGCASFLATGADRPGDGVTALGTTLTLKILSDRPIFAPRYGIYSHKILGLWLAGGASNTGGAALLARFSAEEMAALSARIDPETDSGLEYYPLPKPGERFPINDPALAPRLTPEPTDRALFLKGHFEGIAAVEALGYARLAELGAPMLRSVRTVGGGASNAVWTRIRARKLGVSMPAPLSDEAAYGAALLARRGAMS